MNIHEYQAKEILKEFGAPISDGIVIFDVNNLNEKIKDLNSEELVLKAQIHAGGRGKAGGVKLVKKIKILEEAKKLFGKTLVTPQTGPEGKEVKRIYIQKVYDISKELYLSCIIDRRSAKIAFISSTEGGVDIELVAKNNPEKIITTKIDFKKSLSEKDIENIIKIFNFDEGQKKEDLGIIRDISSGGILFTHARQIRKENLLRLSFEVPKGGKIQQQLAEVRNIRKNPKSVTSPFVTGIKWRNLPSEVESMIKTFVQMRSSDKRSGGR